MKKPTGIYKKVGRRYVEIGEYDNEMLDYVPIGATLIIKQKGMTSRCYNVDPDVVPMMAAAKYCEDAVSRKIMQATELRANYRMRQKELTPGQRRAWARLIKEFWEDARQLEWPSAREAAEAAGQALQEEAEKLLANESIKAAYEHFQLLCKLSAQNTPAEPA
jgi:hypothetical protein